MDPLKSKFRIAVVLMAGSSMVSAHTGDHSISVWHHYLASPGHTIVPIALALMGLGIAVYLLRKSTRKSRGQLCTRGFNPTKM